MHAGADHDGRDTDETDGRVDRIVTGAGRDELVTDDGEGADQREGQPGERRQAIRLGRGNDRPVSSPIDLEGFAAQVEVGHGTTVARPILLGSFGPHRARDNVTAGTGTPIELPRCESVPIRAARRAGTMATPVPLA